MADSTLHSMTEMTAPAIGDELYILDDPGGTPADRRIALSIVFKVINGLTADSTPAGTANYVVTYDASATAAKKVLSGGGTWTPTGTNVANTDSITPQVSNYWRFGDNVVCWGYVNVDATAAALTRVRLTLPIASNLSTTNMAGMCSDGTNAELFILTQLTMKRNFIGLRLLQPQRQSTSSFYIK